MSNKSNIFAFCDNRNHVKCYNNHVISKKTIQEYSFFLHRVMKINIYGNYYGYPILVFPTQDGTSDDYEKYKMVEVLSPFLEKNLIQLFCVDSVDKEGFSLIDGDIKKRMTLQENYYHYIVDEVVPLIHKRNRSTCRILLTGNSMGGYHSANMFFRRPELFEGVISLSGLYDASIFFNGYVDSLIYQNSPLHCLQNMPVSHPYVSYYRNRSIILCVGKGRWEEDGLISQPLMEEQFRRLNIEAFCDYWGYDVDHDWCWWHKQIVYFLPMALKKASLHYPKKLIYPEKTSI